MSPAVAAEFRQLGLRRVIYRMHLAQRNFRAGELESTLQAMGLDADAEEVRLAIEDLAMGGVLCPDGAGGYTLNERRAA